MGRGQNSDRTSNILWLWVAPGVRENLPKAGGAKPTTFWQGFLGPRGCPDSKNLGFSVSIWNPPHQCHPRAQANLTHKFVSNSATQTCIEHRSWTDATIVLKSPGNHLQRHLGRLKGPREKCGFLGLLTRARGGPGAHGRPPEPSVGRPGAFWGLREASGT